MMITDRQGGHLGVERARIDQDSPCLPSQTGRVRAVLPSGAPEGMVTEWLPVTVTTGVRALHRHSR